MEDGSSKGMSFLGVLLVLFVTLKLNGAGAIAAWSWWLVLTPLWVMIVAFVFLVILYLVVK